MHDNLPLLRACSECDIVIPVFVLDPAFTTKPSSKNGKDRVHGTGVGLPSKNVFRFFFETLSDLNRSLSSKQYRSRLMVLRGDPIKVFSKMLSSPRLKVTDLYFESDTEPYSKQRDGAIMKLCEQSRVWVHTDYGQTLYPPESVLDAVQRMEKYKGSIPMTYRGFVALLEKLGDPEKPRGAPPSIPGGDAAKKLCVDKRCEHEMAAISGMNQLAFCVPTTDELGPFEEEKNEKVNEYEVEAEGVHKFMRFVGGEGNAMRTMREYLADRERVCNFEKPKTSPSSLTASTTTLSMYLTNGSLSSRLLWHEIDKIYRASKRGHTGPPTSLHGQLYFREWFYALSGCSEHFHRMRGNAICKQIEWDLYDEERVNRWKLGQTGYPFIDALMIQLRRSGWMHHLGRHAVACFLTRGDLWQSWEVGRDVFAQYLLDGDCALNTANWLWLSASAFFTAYFRVYSPINFGRKTDPNGDFIRHWIPKLKRFPSKYIYAPWTAPSHLQKAWGCVVGEDYPEPMLDHLEAKQINMQRMKAAYDAHKKNKNKNNKKLSGKKRKRNWQ